MTEKRGRRMSQLNGNVLVLYFDRDEESTNKYNIVVVTNNYEVYAISGKEERVYSAIIEDIDLDFMNFQRVGKVTEVEGLKEKVANIHSDLMCRLIRCEVGKGISELYAFNDDNYMMLASYGAVRNVPVNENERNFAQKVKRQIEQVYETIN